MILNFRGPIWFFGFDVAIEIILTLIVIGLVFYGYRAYKLTKEKKYFYFTAGFVIIVLDFIIHSFVNSYIYYNLLVHNFCSVSCQMNTLLRLFGICFWIYAVINLLAYTILAITFTKSRWRFEIFSSIFLLSIPTLYLLRSFFILNLFAFLFLIPIIYVTYCNYHKKKSFDSYLVFGAFSFIFLSHLFYIFEFLSGIFYVLGLSSLFIGYSLLLYLLIRVKKNV
ncbi:MAG TPA: hypothetical protein VJB89_00375 [Candidatus Nanoarchaeia archaeon]|nr:hypothetical protein [Candidatus Nanoarchaeia archaeon]